MAVSGSPPPKTTAATTLLLLLLGLMDPVRCRPTVYPDRSLCPNEDLDDQTQSWPRGIIPYNMSDDLTVTARTELMRSMETWENQTCVMFIPRREQANYVQFLPGERCCSDRGRVGTGQQNVYINNTCIAERTLDSVIGNLIGNQPLETATGTNDGSVNMPDEENGMCGEHIRPPPKGLRGGLIHSPGYPLSYPVDSECVWKISVPENHVIQLQFQNFHTECHYDFLGIYQLTSDGSIYKYTHLCGLQPDQESITTHLSVSSVVIRFHTDETYSHKGFNITYNFKENVHQCHIHNGGCNDTCVTDSSGIGRCTCQPGFELTRKGMCKDVNECRRPDHECDQECENTYGSYNCFCRPGYRLSLDQRTCIICGWSSNSTSGTIQSQGYPGLYPNQQNCKWTIEINPEHVLRLNIALDIAPSNECRVEFLKLQHGHFRYNRRLCGYQPSISFYVNEKNVTSSTLRFRSRNIGKENSSSGFVVNYQQVLWTSVTDEELNDVHIGGDIIEYKSRGWVWN